MVEALTFEAVPVIAPVEAFNDAPAGKLPVVTAYVIAPPSGSVAATEKLNVPPSSSEPNEPAAFEKAGIPL